MLIGCVFGSRPTVPAQLFHHDQTAGAASRLLAYPPPFTHYSRGKRFGGFMTSICYRNFRLGLMLATVLSVSTFATAGFAYTPEQQQACSGDAFQFCGPEIPDVDRVTACMIRNKSRLSPGCRAHFRPEPDEAVVAPAGKPVNIAPATAKKPVSAKAKKPKKPAKPAAT
jgi:hypothetical protein